MRTLIPLALLVALVAALILWLADREGAGERARSGVIPGAAAELAPFPGQEGLRATPTLSEESSPRRAALGERATAEASPARLNVRVTDDLGTPLAGAQIRLSQAQDGQGVVRWSDEARSDDAGRASFEVPLGHDIGVHGQAARHRPASQVLEPFAAGELRELELTLLRSAGTFHGLVLAAEDDRPLSGVEVLAGSVDKPLRDPALLLTSRHLGSPVAWTDAEGRFTLPLEDFGDGQAILRAPERGSLRLTIDGTGADPERPVRVRLKRAASLVGRVLDTGASTDLRVGARCDGYHLSAASPASFDLRKLSWSTPVAADGTFTLTDLPPEVPLEIDLSAGRATLHREPGVTTLAPGETRQVEWRIGAGATLEVLALSAEGVPQSEVALGLYTLEQTSGRLLAEAYWQPERRATSDAGGRVLWPEVAPGEWAVAPIPARKQDLGATPAEAIAPIVVPIRVTLEDSWLRVEVPIERGLFVSGRVVDGTGEPVPQASVIASLRGGRSFVTSNTATDGAFVLGPLAPGDYSIQARAWPLEPPSHAPSEPVVVAAGTRDLELTLRPAGGLRARLVDGASGAPQAGKVVLQASPPGDISMGDARIDGPVEFMGLSPGVYELCGSTAGGLAGCARSLEVVAGEILEVEISLAPGGELSLFYSGPQEYAQCAVDQDGARAAMDGLRSGTGMTVTVPAGRLVVSFTRYTGELDAQGEHVRFVHEETVDVPLGGRIEVRHEVPD